MNWVKEAFSSLPNKPKGWVTVNEIHKETGNNKRTIIDRLNKMVAVGELEIMQCKVNAKACNCYRKKITKRKK